MNAYFEEAQRGGAQQGGDPLVQLMAVMEKARTGELSYHEMREAQVLRWAWAIPNDAALDAIAKLSPIVEIGAGGGYWAKLLRERGAIIEAYDLQPYPLFNHLVSRSHIAIARGGPERALRHYPERTLFLCWPSYNEPWAARALELHRGRFVAYVGERGGCTADERFEELLEERYEKVVAVEIPQWPGLHDWLSIWRRR